MFFRWVTSWIHVNTIKSSKLFKTSNLIIIALIIGLGLGMYINNALTAPKVEGLTADLNQKTNQVSSLNSQLETLQANYTEALNDLVQVTQQYNDLVENSVTTEQFEELEIEYEDLLESHQDQTEELATLRAEHEDLVATNIELSIEYQKLLAKYNELRMVPWTAFVVSNLRVNLTVTTNTYSSNTPITGEITIKYLDGKPFTGRVLLLVWSDYSGNGKTSPIINVSGATQYTIEAPFLSGSGRYYLLVSSIKDASGKEIVSYNDLLIYRVSLQMG
jgi:uncharacterized membrane-anchored protein YhcB (DUF1043 family)